MKEVVPNSRFRIYQVGSSLKISDWLNSYNDVYSELSKINIITYPLYSTSYNEESATYQNHGNVYNQLLNMDKNKNKFFISCHLYPNFPLQNTTY